MGQGPASSRVGSSSTLSGACHGFPFPGTQETQSAMLWGQRVSLGHKRAVCLQLQSVTPFSVLMDQSASSWLCCHPSTGCWLTAVFRSAAPSPPPLGTLQQHSPSGHFHSLAPRLLQRACGARGRPCRATVRGDSRRGLFWRVSVGLSAASLAILRLHPRVSVCRAGRPQTLASRSTPGTLRPHTRFAAHCAASTLY